MLHLDGLCELCGKAPQDPRQGWIHAARRQIGRVPTRTACKYYVLMQCLLARALVRAQVDAMCPGLLLLVVVMAVVVGVLLLLLLLPLLLDADPSRPVWDMRPRGGSKPRASRMTSGMGSP